MDDDWTRHQSFVRQAAALLPIDVRDGAVHPLEIHQAYTGEHARDIMLATPCFDALFLDHDLGESLPEDGVTPGTWSGTEFVDWLVGAPAVLPSKIVIHSWNRYGAHRMAMTLINHRNVYPRREPFSDHLIANVGAGWLVRP